MSEDFIRPSEQSGCSLRWKISSGHQAIRTLRPSDSLLPFFLCPFVCLFLYRFFYLTPDDLMLSSKRSTDLPMYLFCIGRNFFTTIHLDHSFLIRSHHGHSFALT